MLKAVVCLTLFCFSSVKRVSSPSKISKPCMYWFSSATIAMSLLSIFSPAFILSSINWYLFDILEVILADTSINSTKSSKDFIFSNVDSKDSALAWLAASLRSSAIFFNFLV